VGIHNSYLARLESGENDSPSADLLQKIADVLEISSTDLLAFIGVKPPEGLPEFAPYLRAKYRMDDAAIRKLTVYMRRVTRNRDTNINE
jgi:transcriptional regulator with XRE-family HTH domain